MSLPTSTVYTAFCRVGRLMPKCRHGCSLGDSQSATRPQLGMPKSHCTGETDNSLWPRLLLSLINHLILFYHQLYAESPPYCKTYRIPLAALFSLLSTKVGGQIATPQCQFTSWLLSTNQYSFVTHALQQLPASKVSKTTAYPPALHASLYAKMGVLSRCIPRFDNAREKTTNDKAFGLGEEKRNNQCSLDVARLQALCSKLRAGN
jgi:hypothetical protein